MHRVTWKNRRRPEYSRLDIECFECMSVLGLNSVFASIEWRPWDGVASAVNQLKAGMKYPRYCELGREGVTLLSLWVLEGNLHF